MDQSNVWKSSSRAWESNTNANSVSTLFIFSLIDILRETSLFKIQFDFHGIES